MKKKLLVIFVLGLLLGAAFLRFSPKYRYKYLSFFEIEKYEAPSFDLVLQQEAKQTIGDYISQMSTRLTLYPKCEYDKGWLVNGSDSISLKVRVKGDWASHVKRPNWSFRIKQKKGQEYFMDNRKLNFHDPSERNFIFEYTFHSFLKREGLLALDYDFVEIKLKEKKYCYAVEDGIGKSFLKKYNLHGPVFKLNETELFRRIENGKSTFENTDQRLYQNAKLLTRGNKKEVSTDHFLNQNNRINLPLDSFNLDHVAKFVAICDLFGAKHALRWHNLKMVKRNGLYEFIGSDANPVYDPSLSIDKEMPLFQQFFKSNEFVELYKEYLSQFIDEFYVKDFLNDQNSEIKSRINLLESYYPKSDNNIAFLFANIEAINEKGF